MSQEHPGVFLPVAKIARITGHKEVDVLLKVGLSNVFKEGSYLFCIAVL